MNDNATPDGERQGVYLPMADEKLTRIERLHAALEARHIERSDRARHLSQHCGSGISYWSGLLAGARSFGEKAARRVEGCLNLPIKYLDVQGPSQDALDVAELFDLLDSHGKTVLLATAHALMRPGQRPIDGPEPAPN